MAGHQALTSDVQWWPADFRADDYLAGAAVYQLVFATIRNLGRTTPAQQNFHRPFLRSSNWRRRNACGALRQEAGRGAS
jgi:hypothetical protein